MCKVGCISPGGAGGLLVRRKQYISFSLQMLALTFMLGVGVGEGEGEDSVWLFLRVGLSEDTGQDG